MANSIDDCKAAIRFEYEGMKFSETLDTYLELRQRGPDESSGCTDKDYYYRLEVLRGIMNAMVACR